MSDFFGLEGPFMRFFDKVFNLLWLNILVIVCSLPIFTAGAAFTAMHYVVLRMLHNEEGYITKNFFKSFRENFKQATIIWIPAFLIYLALAVDAYLLYKGIVTLPGMYRMVIYFLLAVATVGLVFIFPVLSHYNNTCRGTIRNAYAMGVYNPIKSISMVIVTAAPWAGLFFKTYFIPICFLFGFTVPAYLSSTLYDGIFKRFEEEERKARERLEEAGSEAVSEAREESESETENMIENGSETEAENKVENITESEADNKAENKTENKTETKADNKAVNKTKNKNKKRNQKQKQKRS